ncbi:uncharacterized protein LOC103580566 [Microplitis demolitor]|uniref:uncharacterized protein LOC103580566 n=1 Tax=Microplitis demolitor TaxID=69319 RepID=UPI0004CD7BBA|nr:uncharacterized protein LOC103580566 [Microplitis demolitor]
MKKKVIDKELNWTEDSINALGVYKIITQIMCLWPLESRTICWTIRVTLLIIFLILSCIFVSKEMLEHCGSMKDRILLSAHLITSITSVAKIIILNLNRKNLSTIITNAVDDWEKTNDVDFKKIMNRYALINRTLLYMMLSPALLYVIKVTSDRMPYTLIIDNDTILSCIFVSKEMLEHCGSMKDRILLSAHLLASVTSIGKIIILNLNTKNLSTIITSAVDDWEKTNDVNLRKIMNRYALINRTLLYMMLSPALLYVIKVTSDRIPYTLIIDNVTVLIPFTSLVYIKEQKIMEAVVITAAISLNVSFELFLYCFVGEKLTNEVDKSSFAMYSTSWYNLKPNVWKNIMFVTLKCSKEFRITGGKLFKMNLENFKTIVKTLGSFLSVIRLVVFE